jgi:hypothetical protein
VKATDAAAAAVRAGLVDAGRAFGPPPAAPPALHWGPLFAALDDGDDVEYVLAVELIYEGYLLHYRESRATVPDGDRRAATLLAGDFFYARGLRLVAARGDAAAVGLLARLMGTCSYLRSLGADYAPDDALWAYTMGGLAALRAGTDPAAVVTVFDEADGALAADRAAAVGALVRAAVPRLGLADPAPLLAALPASIPTGS